MLNGMASLYQDEKGIDMDGFVHKTRSRREAKEIVDRDYNSEIMKKIKDSTPVKFKVFHSEFSGREHEARFMITRNSNRKHYGLVNIDSGFVFEQAIHSGLSLEYRLREWLTMLMKHNRYDTISFSNVESTL